MHRRHFLSLSSSLALASLGKAAEPAKRPVVLLRSSWQIVNIGDIAHTPGVLALLEKHVPEAEVILWASDDLSDDVSAMEHKRFPKLKIVKGRIDSQGKATNDALADAVARADFFLHGSGPSLVAKSDLAAFAKHTGKPYGIYGITWGGGDEKEIELLSQAKFVFFRDTVSLEKAKQSGVASPIMEFGPDGAFACDLRNDERASAFLAANQLDEGKFVCCIPRLRYTPYWTITSRPFDEKKHQRNLEKKDADHAPLREAIEAIVNKTDLKVLLCPEDKTQMTVGRDNIWDQLSAKTKERVVWRESFWLTDEALSTYTKSAGLFGLEMHSPIMAIGNGIPALVGRFEEQTSKGFMWRDIGLGDWLFNFDIPEETEKLTPTILAMLQNPEATRETVAKAAKTVTDRQTATMAQLRKELGLGV